MTSETDPFEPGNNPACVLRVWLWPQRLVSGGRLLRATFDALFENEDGTQTWLSGGTLHRVRNGWSLRLPMQIVRFRDTGRVLRLPGWLPSPVYQALKFRLVKAAERGEPTL